MSVRVAVIGAGLAGLRAAVALDSAGCDVTVLEREGHVGGRAAGGLVEGFSVDGTLPLIRSCDRALISFIEHVELGGRLLPPREVELSQMFHGMPHAVATSTLGELAKLPGVRLWDRKRLLRLPRLMDRYRTKLDPDAPERAADLDFRSARDFATLYFGPSLFDHWVSPETTSEYVDDEMELSRVAFLLSRIASREGRATLGSLRQGLWVLAERAAAHVGAIRRTQVHSITARSDGGYTLLCNGPTGSRAFDVDAVVIATPPEVAGEIAAPVLVPAERDYFARYQSGPVVSLSLGLEAPLAPGYRFVRVPKAEASSIECFLCEQGDGVRAPKGTGLVSIRANQRFATANASAGDEIVEKSLIAALSRFHPEVVERVRIARLRRETHENPNFRVGAYRDLARFERVQVDRCEQGRRIYFAGPYRVGPRPEHSLASGRRAARALIEHFALDG